MKKVFKKGICMLLILGLFLGSVPVYASDGDVFMDVPEGHWAKNVILEGYRDGAAGGTWMNPVTGNRYFSPESEVTCAQFSALFAKAFYPVELRAVGAQTPWYGSARIVCGNHNLYEGVQCGIEDDLTRYDMAVMMCNFLRDQKIDMPDETELRNFVQKIPDYKVMPVFYQDSVLKVYTRGLLKGIDESGAFLGEAGMTRAQSMAVYSRLKEVLRTDIPMPEGTLPQTPLEPAVPNTDVKPDQIPEEKPDITGEESRSLANGKPVTSENIQALLLELKKEYPEGRKWDESDRYTSPSVFAKGWADTGGCTSFAFLMQDRIYGKDLMKHPLKVHKNFSELKPGDILYVENPDTGYAHHIVVVHVGDTANCPDGLIPEYRESDAPLSVYGCSGNVNDRISWRDLTDLRDMNEHCEIISRL